MSIRKASAQTTVNRGTAAAAAATTNQITIAPATATTVAGGGSLGGGTISNVAIMSDATYTTVLSGDTAVSTAGGFIRITGTGFRSGANVYLNSTLLTNTFVSSTTINAVVPATSAGSYNLYVINPDNNGVIGPPVATSGFPTFSQTSYSVASLTLNTQLLATGDAPLTYYIQPGSSNPQNLSVSTSGLLTGTLPTDATYTLTVIVDDVQGQSTQDTITIIAQTSEPYFNLTTLSLPGDGTNNANNHSFIDSSSNAFAITRNGNTTQGTFSPFSQTGWSNFFDGSGDYLSAAYNSAFAFPGDFTIEFWVNWSAHGSSGGFVTNMQSSGGAPAGWQIIFNGANDTVSLEVAGSYPFITSSSTLPKNTWAHVAVVRSGSATNNVKMYFDGVQVAQGTNTSTLDSTNASLFIGCERTGGAFITGYMSNVRIVKGTAVYTSAFTPPTSPLTAITNTQLLTCQSNRFIDNSSNAFTITRNGDVSVQAFSPFAPTAAYTPASVGGSGYFDGTGDYLTSATNTALQLGSSDFSIEWWEYRTAANNVDTAIVCGDGTFSALLGYYNSGAVRFYLSTTGSSWNVFSDTSAGTTASNSWNHFVLTRSGTAFRVFLNGVLGAYATGSGSVTQTTNQIFISGGINGSSTPIEGYMSGVRFVKGSIPTSYQTSSTTTNTSIFTPPTAPVTTTSQGATSEDVKYLVNFTNAGIIDVTAKNTFETVGDAKISTAQSKFGGSSMFFDGTDDRLKIPYNPNLLLGSGNFAVEMWLYKLANTAFMVAAGNLSAPSSAAWTIISDVNGNLISWYTNGNFQMTSTTSLATSTWYHLAITRSGTTGRLFINGVQEATWTDSINYNVTNDLFIGNDAQLISGRHWNGYIEDFRITRGFARYTANFTPPTAAFSLR